MVSIRKMCLTLAASLGATLLMASTAQAQVDVSIYEGFQDVDGGAPFSGLVGSFNAPMIDFASTTGYAWHPFGLGSFGALLTGCIRVPESGLYTFGTNSDDGSMFYLDNNLIVNNGGPHPPSLAFGAPVALAAGNDYHFRLEFFEDFGGPSGLDLVLDTPNGPMIVPERFFVECSNVPEPGTLALFSTFGLTGLGLAVRRRARK